MTFYNIIAFIILEALGYTCLRIPKYTKKWADDRTMEQLGAFFYGAAVVVLFV